MNDIDIKKIKDLKRRGKKEKRSRSNERGLSKGSSLGNLFNRGHSVRKDKEDAASKELSLDSSNPGVLKVFGAQLQMGTEYKSILVSAGSTAEGILAEVLERLGLSRDLVEDYILCEVLGKLSPGSVTNGTLSASFVEEYCRPLYPTDLVEKVQSLWNPLKGLYRRFEIRERNLVRSLTSGSEKNMDRETQDLNENAKRFARVKQVGSRPSISSSIEPLPVPTSCQACQTDLPTMEVTDRRSRTTRHVPLGPYLLLLKGCDQRQDLLIHELYDNNILGSSPQCDIILHSQNLPEEACVIQTDHSSSPDGNYSMFVEPLGECPITLNDISVTGKTSVSPGDFLSISGKYTFLHKDTSRVPDRLLKLPSLTGENRSHHRSSINSGERDHPPRPSCVPTIRTDFEPDNDSIAELGEALARCVPIFVDQVFRHLSNGHVDHTTGATLIIMLSKYASSQPGEASEEVQWQISEAVCNVCQRASQERQDESISSEGITPILRITAFLFEVLEYFRTDEEKGGGPEAAGWRGFYESVAQQVLDDHLMNLAEESVSLAAALYEDNPFTGTPHHPGAPGMQDLLTHLNSIINAFRTVEVPATLYFRSVVFRRVMAMLAERVVRDIMADGVCLRWTRGVQIRANLDLLDQWCQAQGLLHLEDYMIVLGNVADLLATTRTKLYQMSWSDLRTTFSQIPPAVLKRLLDGYEDGKGSDMVIWTSTPRDEEEVHYDPQCALHDQLEHLLQDDGVLQHHREPPIRLTVKTRDPDFTAYLIQFDAELADESVPLRWRTILNSILHQSPKVTPPSSTKQLFTLSPPSRQGQSVSGPPSGRRGGRLTSTPTHRRDSGKSIASTKAKRVEELRHLKEMARSLQSLCQRSQERSRAGSIFEDTNSEPVHRRGLDNSGKASSGGSARSGPPTKNSNLQSQTSSVLSADEIIPLNTFSDEILDLGSAANGFSNNCDEMYLGYAEEPDDRYFLDGATGDDAGDVFVVTLKRDLQGSLGLGLIDGQLTSLQERGLYIRTFRSDGPAEKNGNLHLGDQILAVNDKSIVDLSYHTAMELLREAGQVVNLKVAKSDLQSAMKIIAPNS